MAQKGKFPDSWEEFLEIYNKMDFESRWEVDNAFYEFLVSEGKIEPIPEIEALKKEVEKQERLAEEHERKALECKRQLEELRKEMEKAKGKNPRNAGRKIDDEKINKFVNLYEAHKPMNEIMKEVGISRRTYYRYKKLYLSRKR